MEPTNVESPEKVRLDFIFKQIEDNRKSNENFLNMKYGLDNNEEKLDYIFKQVSKKTPKTPEVEKPVDTDNFDMLAYIEQKDPEVHGSIISAANADGYEDVDSMVKDAQNTAIKELRDWADNAMFKEQYTKEHDKEMNDMGLVSDGEVSDINTKETVISFEGEHITVPPSETKAPKVPQEQLVKLGEEKKQAERYHGIGFVTLEEYSYDKDLTGDDIINDLHRNIELMSQGSSSFEANIAMKSQALQNIAKLIGASKVQPEAYSRLSEVFPDVNFANPKEAYMLLKYKVQSAAQELAVAYNEQSSPEGRWNKFVVDIGQEHFSEKIESTLDLHEFVEDVINDRDYKIYSRAEQSKIFSMYKSLMGEKKNFFTEVKEDAVQRNLLDVTTQAIDNGKKDIPAVMAKISFRESGWNFLAHDPSDYGKLKNGEPLPTKRYRDAVAMAEDKFAESFNKTIPGSVDPDSDNYAEQKLGAIGRFHSLMERDAEGVIIGVRADAVDDVVGYSTLISAILDTQNKVGLNNENPFLKAAAKDLMDKITIFGNLDLDPMSSELDADLAQGAFASVVILKELFKERTPIQKDAIAEMLGIKIESADVLSFLSYALVEAFDNAAQGTLGRLSSVMKSDDPMALKKFLEQHTVDLTVVQSVMNLLTATRSEPQGIGGMSDYLEGDATGGAFYKYDIDTMVESKLIKDDTEFQTWGENTVRYFTRSRISFPAKDSEREKGFKAQIMESGIYSESQRTELLSLGNGSENQRQLMYIVHLQTLLRFSDKENQNRLSSIDKVAMMLKASGGNTYDTGIQTVFDLLALDVKPGVIMEDGTELTDSTVELPKQGTQSIGLTANTVKTYRLSDPEDGDSLSNAVKHWGNNGVNLARSVSRPRGYFGRVWTEMGKSGGGIPTKPGDYGGLSGESYASQSKSIIDGHNAAEADMNTMTQTLRSNMSYARWMDYAIDLGISEADWNTMVGNAINKTFDPVREKLREVISSNKDRFTYGNEQAHLSVLYHVLKEAGGEGWMDIKAEHLRPMAQTNRGKHLNPQQIDAMESRRTAQKDRLLKTITPNNRNKIVSIMQQSSWGQNKDYSSIANDELVLDYFELRLDPGAQAIDQNKKMAPILGFMGTTIGVHRDGTRLVLQLKGQTPIALPWSTEPDGNLPEQKTKDFSVDFGSPSLLDQAKKREREEDIEFVQDILEWQDEDNFSWTESVAGIPLSLNPEYWWKTGWIISGMYKDTIVDGWDYITDGYWGSQSQEEVDELLLKAISEGNIDQAEGNAELQKYIAFGESTLEEDTAPTLTSSELDQKVDELLEMGETNRARARAGDYTGVTRSLDPTGSGPDLNNPKIRAGITTGNATDELLRDLFVDDLKEWDQYEKTSKDYATNTVINEGKLFNKKADFTKFTTDANAIRDEITKGGGRVITSEINLVSDTQGLHGKPDVIVMTEKGKIRIYDVKIVSGDLSNINKKYDGDKYSRQKKYSYQLNKYADMLEERGYTVEKIGLIPIRRDDKKVSVQKIGDKYILTFPRKHYKTGSLTLDSKRVTTDNEMKKIQVLDEAREAGATVEELDDMATDWYMPDGGLQQLNQDSMETEELDELESVEEAEIRRENLEEAIEFWENALGFSIVGGFGALTALEALSIQSEGHKLNYVWDNMYRLTDKQIAKEVGKPVKWVRKHIMRQREQYSIGKDVFKGAGEKMSNVKAKAFKILQKPGRLVIARKVATILGKIVPPLSIPLLLWGNAEDAKLIADKLTQNELETLQRIRDDVKQGADPVAAHIINQLANFARSPGTKF